MDEQYSLLELFNEYFEVVPADTPEKLRECYRLRYEVYCKEALIPGFDVNDYPEGLEYDQDDERSVHCLLRHKPSRIIAGTVRVILPDQDKPDTKFPLEKFAGDWFYADIVSLETLPRAHLGEISRLILAPEFRGRQGENGHPYGMAEDSEFISQHIGRFKTNIPWNDSALHKNIQRRTFPHALLGLLVAVARMSIEHNLTYLYVGMEPICARLLQGFGINLKPISPIVDYYGPCRGYLGSIPDIGDNTYRTNQQLWTLLTNDGALYPRPK